MRIMCMAYPVWARGDLHLNSTGNAIVLPTDEMIKLLIEAGHVVDVVNFFPDSKHKNLPLMRSGVRMKSYAEVDAAAYDLFIHMFKDPTQPEVLAILHELHIDYHGKPVLNDASRLADFTKWKYLKLLHEKGLGPAVHPEIRYQDVQWGPSTYCASISSDKKYVHSGATNNNRGDYPERRNIESIVADYIDNEASGVRSFFRLGYAVGGVTSGWMYCSTAEQTVQKSGSCKHQVPLQLPHRYARQIIPAFACLGVDYCHFEGCFKDRRMYIFDINPHPTSHGGTLSVITEEMVDRILSRYNPGQIADGPVDSQ